MKVLVINNDGSGYADYVEVNQGTTVAQLFDKQLPASSAEDYLIRVNRQPVAADELLKEGDRISMTPVKIHGAQAA